jgi:hypothetical protein
MIIQNIGETLKEAYQNFLAKLEENATYNTLKEKFDSLTPQLQKLIMGGALTFVLIMLFMFPYGYYSSSKDFDAQFNEKRQLLRELLRASRISTVETAVNTFDRNEIENQVRQMLGSFALLPEQFEGVVDLNEDSMGPSLAPAEIKSINVGAQFKKLNLKQMQEIGYRLQNIDTSVKLIGLDLQADKDNDHYFNVLYKLSGYFLNENAEPSTADSKAAPSKTASKKPRVKRKKTTEGGE